MYRLIIMMTNNQWHLLKPWNHRLLWPNRLHLLPSTYLPTSCFNTYAGHWHCSNRWPRSKCNRSYSCLNQLDITIISIDLRLQDQLQMQRTAPTGFNDQVNPNHSSVSYARSSPNNLVSEDNHQPLHVKPFLGITFSKLFLSTIPTKLSVTFTTLLISLSSSPSLPSSSNTIDCVTSILLHNIIWVHTLVCDCVTSLHTTAYPIQTLAITFWVQIIA